MLTIILKGIIYGVLVYCIFSILSLIVLLIATLFNDSVKGLVFGGNINLDISALKSIMLACIALYFIFNVILYIISYKIFKKGVNID